MSTTNKKGRPIKITDERQAKFIELMHSKGIDSLSKFANMAGIDAANFYNQFRKDFALSMPRLFLYANTLKVPVTDILDIFEPELMAQNRKIVGE